ncbi:MAG: hypothetical protein GKS06_19630 [Acidobacteria bacterium]|nr:hypothetical protein [Acidobacteriota bacterium]
MSRSRLLVTALALIAVSAAATAQEWTPDKPGSDNITVVAHMPLGAPLSVADIEIEQELDRPYVYVAREVFGEYGEKGMDVIDIRDPENPKLIHEWRIENQDLHAGAGSKDIKYFVWNERYYVLLSVQFGQGGPNPDLRSPAGPGR